MRSGIILFKLSGLYRLGAQALTKSAPKTDIDLPKVTSLIFQNVSKIKENRR
jgi:hypothetical protein